MLPVATTKAAKGLQAGSKQGLTVLKPVKKITRKRKAQKGVGGRAVRVREPSNASKQPHGTTGRPTKYDWKAAASGYVEGIAEHDGIKFPNLREVSEHFDIPYARVREVSARDRWSEQRNGYQIEQAAAKRKGRIAKLAGDSMDFDDNAFVTAKMGMAAVTQRLAEIHKEAQSKRALREDAMQRLERGEPVEKWELYSAYRPQDLDMLARAAATFQQIGQRALGTDVQKIEVGVEHGGEVQHTHSVRQEMLRDDTERLAAIIEGLGQTDPRMKAALEHIIDADIVEGDVEEEPVVIGTETPLPEDPPVLEIEQ
jgi:hypothetical protein